MPLYSWRKEPGWENILFSSQKTAKCSVNIKYSNHRGWVQGKNYLGKHSLMCYICVPTLPWETWSWRHSQKKGLPWREQG